MNDRAGTPATADDLVDLDALIAAYHERVPDVSKPEQQVVFGTSGHRGSSLDSAFNDTHIAAITQAIVEYRTAQGTDGPLFIGRDTHALSAPAERTALEVLAANGVHVLADAEDGYVPTPALSHAIIAYNKAATTTPPTASSSRRATTRRATAASSTTRRTAAPRTVTPRAGSPSAPTRSSPAATPRSGAPSRPRRTATTSSGPTSPTSRTSSTSPRSSAPASASVPTRSVAPPCPTGSASATTTVWT